MYQKARKSKLLKPLNFKVRAYVLNVSNRVLTNLFEVAVAEDLEDFLDGDLNNLVALVGAAVMPLLFSLDLDC